jgi:hypothetical protein
MNPVDCELDFVGVEEFNAAIEWFEYVPYAEIARHVKIAVPEMDLFVKEGEVCRLVPRVGQYLDPNRWMDSDDDDDDEENDVDYQENPEANMALWICTNLG